MQISIFDTKAVLDPEREMAILQQGFEEGELEERRATVIRCFQLGLDIDIITKGTCLSEEEVKKIIEE